MCFQDKKVNDDAAAHKYHAQSLMMHFASFLNNDYLFGLDMSFLDVFAFSFS